MPNPKLELQFLCLYWPDQIPNGHLLATFEEVRSHIKTIRRPGGIQRITKRARAMPRGERMHFLDGYMTSPSHDHILQETELYIRYKLVVTDKEWDDNSRTWKAKSSACYSSDGVLLRDRLYNHIHVSHNARQTALLHAMNDSDSEVLYWLLSTTTSSEELNSFKLSMNRRPLQNMFDKMVACLLSTTFPFQLPLELDSSGNTATDYAIQFTKDMADQKQGEVPRIDINNSAICMVELLVKLFSTEIVHWKNKNGMSFLDMAEKEADHGLIHIFTKLMVLSPDPLENDLVRIEPRFQAVLLEAVERGYVPLVEKLLEFKVDMTTDVYLGNVLTESRDSKGRTLLHIAVSKGNKNMVDQLLDKLLALFGNESHEVAKYVKETYSFRRSALQMACRAGHRDIVKVLLDKGMSDPLKERDVNGNTPLHYAAQGNDPEVAVAICQLLLESCSDFSERSLLLWASAGGIGTADEGQNVHHAVKTFLKTQKASHRPHLLRTAAMKDSVEMAWELVNRGAHIHDLRDPQWDERLDTSVINVLSKLELLKERERDQPSMQDKLVKGMFYINSFLRLNQNIPIHIKQDSVCLSWFRKECLC